MGATCWIALTLKKCWWLVWCACEAYFSYIFYSTTVPDALLPHIELLLPFSTAAVGGVGDNGAQGCTWIWVRAAGVWSSKAANLFPLVQ